jgi:hypothetical protein
MRGIWIGVALWLGGCDIPPDVKSQMACTTLCTCDLGSAASVEACTNECVEDGDFAVVPEDCFECIQAHANQCTTLEDDCEPLCNTAEPPQEDLPDGGIR